MGIQSDNEKVSINLAPAEIGKIDVLVAQGLFTSRSDLIRAGLRHILEENQEHVEKVRLGSAGIGLMAVTRKELEAAKRKHERINIKVIGIFVITADITPDLADETINEIRIFGTVRASKAVLARLGNRIKHGLTP